MRSDFWWSYMPRLHSPSSNPSVLVTNLRTISRQTDNPRGTALLYSSNLHGV